MRMGIQKEPGGLEAFILKTIVSSWRILSRGMMLSNRWALRAVSDGVGSLVLNDLRRMQAGSSQTDVGWSSFVCWTTMYRGPVVFQGLPLLGAEVAEVSETEPLPYGVTLQWGKSDSQLIEVVVLDD